MPNFRYRAKDEDDQTHEGIIQAATADVGADLLADEGLVVLSLKEEKVPLAERSLEFLNRVKIKDLVIFSRQLSVIISATIPLVQGLKILIEQTESPVLKTIISEISDDIEGGAKLSSALARHPQVFSNFFINIVKSGETSGKLDEVLIYLADQQEKDYDLSAKIKGAMIYPAFIISGLAAVGSLMMVVVVPQLTSVLTETGVTLPLSTRILIGISDFMTAFWWLLLIFLVLAIVGLRMAIKTVNGKKYWDTFILRLPVFGSLFQKIILVRFSRSLHTLITGGVPLTKSLEIVSAVVGNSVYQKLIEETVTEVEDGRPIATIFLDSKEVPAMVSQMLNLGEKTGRIDEILDKLADFYSREVDNLVSNLVTLLEPMVMIMMGVAVGILVSAIILPMYNLASSL
ncbi:MAG: phytochrome sensor protein [Parcubacteria group bacterium]|jgi:type IV pilus assembly protein PilC|nr:phytochrome sensor protein [Parcubacteria group bacterium]|tara:strand:- start:616 stop:1821 length:1206 start_codon:yes stop_codon:yes gene_type:complete